MLVIASDSVLQHTPLNPQHARVISTTRVCIDNLRDTIDMDGWRTTGSFPTELMQAAPDASFDENRNPGNTPGYQWYGQIELAFSNLQSTVIAWRNYNQEIDYQRRNRLEEGHLPGGIKYVNRMDRELCGIHDLFHVVDGFDLVFRYRRFWTARKMRQPAPVPISILGLLQDLTKVPGRRLAI